MGEEELLSKWTESLWVMLEDTKSAEEDQKVISDVLHEVFLQGIEAGKEEKQRQLTSALYPRKDIK